MKQCKRPFCTAFMIYELNACRRRPRQRRMKCVLRSIVSVSVARMFITGSMAASAISWCASRATLFQWDKFVLPWPFCRIVIAIGPPRQVPRTLQPAALEALQKEMALELKRLFGVARDALQADKPKAAA